jgi:hypothetical protein
MKGKCKINAFSHSQETLLNEKSLIEFAPLPLEICALKPANFHLLLPSLDTMKAPYTTR